MSEKTSKTMKMLKPNLLALNHIGERGQIRFFRRTLDATHKIIGELQQTCAHGRR